MNKIQVPGTGGDRYIPYEERSGGESVVFFTRELSAEGLRRMYARVSETLTGRIAIKAHSGEPHGPNIIPVRWVEQLIKNDIPGGTVVETNTYYKGARDNTESHRETLRINGWDFCPVDILDEEGTTLFPVNNGKWFSCMSVGGHMANYDSLLTLTHFKGHTQGGFGGSNKNLGIGCADGRQGKNWIHTPYGSWDQWGTINEELMEKISESAKSVIDHFAGHIAYINVLRNMSVSCDCEGMAALPVVTPNIGILASLDLLAIDQASVDLIFALEPSDGAAMRERILTRHGIRQLSYMKELGVGNDRYRLIDTDNGDAEISLKDAVKDVVPFEG